MVSSDPLDSDLAGQTSGVERIDVAGYTSTLLVYGLARTYVEFRESINRDARRRVQAASLRITLARVISSRLSIELRRNVPTECGGIIYLSPPRRAAPRAYARRSHGTVFDSHGFVLFELAITPRYRNDIGFAELTLETSIPATHIYTNRTEYSGMIGRPLPRELSDPFEIDFFLMRMSRRLRFSNNERSDLKNG